MKRALFVLALLTIAPLVRAQGSPASSDSNSEARHHFQQGVEQARQGNLVAALREFESAYGARPHFSVLYNIGQAYATLGKPVEAVASFERYLAEGGAQVSGARRAEVEQLIATNRKRIGQLRIVAPSPEETKVWLDGRELPPASLAEPVTLVAGPHSIMHSVRASSPSSQEVSVVAETTLELNLPAPSPPHGEPAQLEVECAIPDVEIEVAGVSRSTTPVNAPLLIPSGALTVRFSRPGYQTITREISARPHEVLRVGCQQKITRPLPERLAGRLRVHSSPAQVEVLVDGERFVDQAIPAGIHRLRLERDGFLPRERLINVAPGKTTTIEEHLSPTAATLAQLRAQRSRKRTSGLILGSAGVVGVAFGAGLYAWNTGRFNDWQATRARLSGDENLQRVTSLQRADDAAIGSFLLGAGLALAGSWLFFSAE
jgi:hypothetical protein